MPIGHSLTVSSRAAAGSRAEGATASAGAASARPETDDPGPVEGIAESDYPVAGAPPPPLVPDETPAEPEPEMEAGPEPAGPVAASAAEGEPPPDGNPEPEAEAEAQPEAESRSETQPETQPEPPATEVTDSDRHHGDPQAELIASLRWVRAELGQARFPLALPDAAAAAERATALTAQLDDYLLPRLARLDAPLLMVVGGPTGAGKSTLVNSLVRAPVSQAGVLRPTTRAPVLVSAPGDMRWFLATAAPTDPALLPGLERTTGHVEPGALRMISAPGLPRGVALLDAPDLDSIVTENRRLAEQLLAAGDLWLFVTSAARYSDAVPWAALRAARDRGTRLALLLNRVPDGAEDEILDHLAELLDAENLADIQLFVLPEATLDGQGLLAEHQVAPIAAWLTELGEDPHHRVRVVGDTLGGALAALRWGAEEVADALDRQYAAGMVLRESVREGYAAARFAVESAIGNGILLRGEVLPGWWGFVHDGGLDELLRAPLTGPQRRPRSAASGGRLLAALSAALATLVAEVGAQAADRVRAAWMTQPAGAALLSGTRPDGAETRLDRARVLAREWLARIPDETGGEATALLVALGVLGGDLPLDDRLRSRVHGVLGHGAVRALVGRSRADRFARILGLLDADAAALTGPLAKVDAAAEAAHQLRQALLAGPQEEAA